MFRVRPAAIDDLDALAALAEIAPRSAHTLPRSRSGMAGAVDASEESFASVPDVPGAESYMFVLEKPDGDIAGCATFSATAGARGRFLAFRRDILHQASRDLDIKHCVQALTLSSDLTACSQLSGFVLTGDDADNIATGAAALLSRARLLFAALEPQRFSERIFSSMAGVTDQDGRSPIWEALGRKFFRMDFLQAERMIEGARDRTVIVELMPHYPVYVPLLPAEAQAVLGQAHAEAELPFALLTVEGFEANQYVDIFDGGPILQAHRSALRTFAQAAQRELAQSPAPFAAPSCRVLVAAAREDRFRAVVADARLPDLSHEVWLEEAARRALDVTTGDAVLCVKW